MVRPKPHRLTRHRVVPRGANTRNALVTALLLTLFLALSAYSSLYILFHDRDALHSRMLATARVLEHVVQDDLAPPMNTFRLQVELDAMAEADPRIIRLELMAETPERLLETLASTWPSRIGRLGTDGQLAILDKAAPDFAEQTMGNRQASVLLLPMPANGDGPRALLEMAMEATRPAGMVAGIYAIVATSLMALMVAHFLYQQRALSGELARRRSAEADLLHSNDLLEDAVRLRTRELTDANARLEREAAERRRMAEDLGQSLSEKETLLQEIHHRVKNNLQIVASLLDMASRRSSSPEVQDICTELSSKVHGISLVHTQLYQSETLDSIDMAEYVRELNTYLVRVYNAAHVALDLHVAAAPDTPGGHALHVPMAVATPLGMVLNELLTNAYKHAFKDGRQGTVTVTLARNGSDVDVSVADDGPGIPPGFDPASADSLGMRLSNNIVSFQLKGTLTFSPPPGTTATIHFDLAPFDGDAPQ